MTQRRKMPFEQFADPQQRKYPIDTIKRARNAPARASEMANKGIISRGKERSIDERAHHALERLKAARAHRHA